MICFHSVSPKGRAIGYLEKLDGRWTPKNCMRLAAAFRSFSFCGQRVHP